MLSKMAKPVFKTDDLDKCKLPELKEIARQRGLRISGKKEDLKQRIQENISQHSKANMVQRAFRGHMARQWIRLKKTSSATPVNDTDFYTLEPVKEMEFLYYIDYVDEQNNITYVFNINSLMNLFTKTGSMTNPYTRDKLDVNLLHRMIRIIHYTYIMFPGSELINCCENAHAQTVQTMQTMQTQNAQSGQTAQTAQTVQTSLNSQNAQTQFAPALPLNPDTNYTTLANELFMKLDALGNYTNIGWFTRLNNTQLCLFIMRLCHFWNKIERSLRRKICSRRNLFSTENLGINSMDENRPIAENRALVIRIGETLVNDGIDTEHRTLGAMYFLTGLTVVSMEVRQELPWLYDNYFVITQQL